jgi:hypothetical protein
MSLGYIASTPSRVYLRINFPVSALQQACARAALKNLPPRERVHHDLCAIAVSTPFASAMIRNNGKFHKPKVEESLDARRPEINTVSSRTRRARETLRSKFSLLANHKSTKLNASKRDFHGGFT